LPRIEPVLTSEGNPIGNWVRGKLSEHSIYNINLSLIYFLPIDFHLKNVYPVYNLESL
jgi:hypothetical protein